MVPTTRAALVLPLAAAAAGCLPFSMLQSARAIPAGTTQVGVGASVTDGGHKQIGPGSASEGTIEHRPSVALTVSLRHGLGAGHDFGITVPVGSPAWAAGPAVGAYVDTKWSWASGSRTHALAPGAGLYFLRADGLGGHGEAVTNRLFFAQLPYLIGIPLGSDNARGGRVELVLGPRLGGGLALLDSGDALVSTQTEHAHPFGTAGFGIGVPMQVSNSIKLMPEIDAHLAVHGNWTNEGISTIGLFIGRGNFTWGFTFGVGLLLGG